MISIVLPTFNESQNLPELLKRIAGAFGRATYEVIVVDDDSPDRTWEVAQGLTKQYPHLRVIRRVGRRGLSSAVVEGFDAATGNVLIVMDSDLQHDPVFLTQLQKRIEQGADLAVASRYMAGGSVGDWVTGRRLLSNTATWIAMMLPPVHVSDPMSGFFAIRRSAYERVRPMLRPTGFKILFEILGHLPRTTKTAEIPLIFRMRLHGASKLSLRVELEFLFQLLRIALYRLQVMLFWLVCAITAIILLLQFTSLLRLYTNASVRLQVQQTMQSVAAHNGWLLSDMTILHVWDDHFLIAYQPHHFGDDPMMVCYLIVYDDPVLQEVSCDV